MLGAMRKHLIYGLLLCLGLTACSGEPSAGDMEKALLEVVQQTIALTAGANMPKINGRPVQIEQAGVTSFDSFSKEACTAVPERQGWRCAFRMTARQHGALQSGAGTGLFLRTDSGWRVELEEIKQNR